jgi:hypothetical protein
MGLDDRAFRGIMWRQLAAREEGGLRLPGSAFMEEVGYNEGEGWGFDRLQKSAMYQCHWTVNADAHEVEEWFREQLTARGWELHSSQRRPVGAPIEADFYRRGAASFVVRVWQEDEATHYDITFSDSSPEPS